MSTIRIPRILSAVYGQPWAVLPPTLNAIVETVNRYATNRADVTVNSEDDQDEAMVTRQIVGNVGMVLVQGIIGSHLSSLETDCGGYDLDTFTEDMDAMAKDSRAECVLLVMRTPGGCVTGVPEAASIVANYPKSVFALTDNQCASAGYWIASQAQEVWLTPSSEVGSVGVYSAIVDESAAWAKEGFKLELMKAGKHKAAGIPGLPLSDEDKAMIQSEVDDLYSQFTTTVSRKRPSVSMDSMQGQMFRGQKAVDSGLADMVVSGIGEAIQILSRK